jgi:hypothetical protein
MTRKRGNPNWGRPIAPALALATEFELRARQLQLTPEMYASSAQLRTWCKQTGIVSTSQNGCLEHGAEESALLSLFQRSFFR